MRKIVFVIFVLFPVLIFSQEDIKFKKANFPNNPSGVKMAKKNIAEGDDAIAGQRYTNALTAYMRANKFNPNNSSLNYKIGHLYYTYLDKFKCLKYFQKAFELNPSVGADCEFYLARGYHLNNKFNLALEHYENLLETSSDSKKEEISNYIEQCKYGKKLVANPLNVIIENAGANLNSEYKEYGPIINADGSTIAFTSRRRGTTGGHTDPADGMYYEDVYYAEKDKDNLWSKAKNIGRPINTPAHDAVMGISQDGQTLYVYSSNKNGDIYIAKSKGSKYAKPTSISDKINTSAQETKACLSYDGKTLYFVSNNDDKSLGGKDIFASHLNIDGEWEEPFNLGTTINTEFDEESPYMHPDGKTLYFSSKGHSSMGGYDIFKTYIDSTGHWSKPVNIGYPINTADDDVFFTISGDGKTAYYSSWRQEGLGMFDIYEITFKEEVKMDNKVDRVKSYVTLLKGTIKDAETLEALKADIEIIDNDKHTIISNFESNSASGNYLISLPSGKNYGLAVSKDGYIFHSENFNIPDTAEYQQKNIDILLHKMEVGAKVVLKNIFFDHNKASLRSASTSELDRLVRILKEQSSMKIEIGGHTDNIGSLDYNLKLSAERAKTVVNYIISKGINKDRLTFKGYAFNKPIADNDTEEGKQLNRRVEFEITDK